jgi:bifunctional non-homologous end joining protein LigD
MRKTKNIFSGIPDPILKKRKKIAQPGFIDPMLATLTKKYFDDPNWIFEHKFDGERCLAFKKNGKVILKSRNNHEINIEYPELAQAIAKQKADNFIIDGEIVALKNGVSKFELLQSRINRRLQISEKQDLYQSSS